MSSRTLLLLASLAPFTLGAAEPPTPPLPTVLQRLAEQDAQVHRLETTTDVTRVEHEEELDRSGKAQHVVERVVRVTHPGGQEHEELVRSSRDQQDDTAETRLKFDEAQRSYREAKVKQPRRDDSQPQNPFAASEQGKYDFSLLPPDASAPGLLRIHFQPRGERTPVVFEGEARVRAAPVSLQSVSMSPSSLPSFVKHSAVELTYRQLPLGPVLSEIAFSGEGGVLFMTKRFRGRVSFQDFQPR